SARCNRSLRRHFGGARAAGPGLSPYESTVREHWRRIHVVQTTGSSRAVFSRSVRCGLEQRRNDARARDLDPEARESRAGARARGGRARGIREHHRCGTERDGVPLVGGMGRYAGRHGARHVEARSERPIAFSGGAPGRRALDEPGAPMSIRWCALVGVLLAGFARAASADEAAEGTDGACRAYLDARLRSCDTLLGQQEKLPEAEKRVADAQQRVAERQRAYDAAAPEAQAAARAELDEALGELASAEAAVLEARKAGTRYDEEDCAAFASVGQVPANVDACDTLASLVGMIRAVRGHREHTTQVPRAEVRERLEAAAIGAQTPATGSTVNKSGTPAQIEPVETTRPIALAGGALSFAGTESGGETVATITINPLALGNPNDVRAQRALDLSVTAPVATNGDGRELRFVGIRLRTNGTALYGYDSLRAAAAEYARAAGAFADSVETA